MIKLVPVRIFDSTLRDGEQSPGATLTTAEKVRLALLLEQLGVDVIEAGFPTSSPGDFEAVRLIAESVSRCEVAGLTRTGAADIERTAKAICGARFPLIHVFLATSRLHLEHKLRMTEAEALREIERAVRDCRSLSANVEFSAEDATRSEWSFLKEAVIAAAQSGATIINIPDTVGYTMPEEYKALIEAVVEAVLPIAPVVVSAHCHNDLGLAVANSLAALSGGARQVECCVNGIGERAGNAALEEIVMALRVRKDLMAFSTRIETTKLCSTSRMVSALTGMPIQHNKAIVGRNAFAHEAGVHQHAILKDKRTYEIMRPEEIGQSDSRIVLGKHSGRAALRHLLNEKGVDLPDSQLADVFERFKDLADKKKRVYDEDILALVSEEMYHNPSYFKLDSVEVHSGNKLTPWARARLLINGQLCSAESIGDGPVHAALEAIKRCVGTSSAVLRDYQMEAVTSGSDAQGRVSLTVEDGGVIARGHATHTDSVVASAQAFVNALNLLRYQIEQKSPAEPAPEMHKVGGQS